MEHTKETGEDQSKATSPPHRQAALPVASISPEPSAAVEAVIQPDMREASRHHLSAFSEAQITRLMQRRDALIEPSALERAQLKADLKYFVMVENVEEYFS